MGKIDRPAGQTLAGETLAAPTLIGVARAMVVVGLLGLGAGGCSQTASQLLTTGSLFGASKTADAKPAPPPPVQPVDRALQVAAVSARAQKCGYMFDPAALRANYLAFEAAGGASPEDLAGLGQRYDFTLRQVASAIAGNDDYCSDGQVDIIKTDLNRHLAGDFTPRRAAAAPSGGGWLDAGDAEERNKFDREKVFQPQGRPL